MNRLFADLSNNNASVDFVAYRRAGHRFVVLKATEGVGWIDPTYRARVVAAHAAGLAVGHYHFARPSNHPHGWQEAAWFVKVVRAHLRRGDRVILDIEEHHPDGPGALAAYVHEFDHEVTRELSRHKIVGYSYMSFMAEHGPAMDTRLGKWWVADYAPTLTRPRWLSRLRLWGWQRTDGSHGPAPHSVAGVGQCDVSLLSRGPYLRILAERALARRKR